MFNGDISSLKKDIWTPSIERVCRPWICSWWCSALMSISTSCMLDDLSLNTHIPTAVLGIWHPVWNCWKLLEPFKTQIKWTSETSRKFTKSFLFSCLSKSISSQTNVLSFSAWRSQAHSWLPVLNPVVANISKPLNVAIYLKQKSLHGHEP